MYTAHYAMPLMPGSARLLRHLTKKRIRLILQLPEPARGH